MPETETTADIATLTVQLLSAYLSNNSVAADDLAGLIRTTRAALVDDIVPAQAEPEAPEYIPAVSVRKSLSSPDHILSLIDGKPYKTLKRHLGSNGLTPEQYRERYNLPSTYPMVSPTFAARRREIAEQIGLGSKGRSARSAARAELATQNNQPSDSANTSADVAASDPQAAAASVNAKPSAKPKAGRAVARKGAQLATTSETSPTAEAAQEPIAATPKAIAEKPRVAKASAVQKPAGKTASVAKPVGRPKVKAVEPVSGSPVPGDAPAEAAAPVVKRRGKLGLFKGSDAAVSSAADSPPAAGEGKAPRARRMARAPKDAAPTSQAE